MLKHCCNAGLAALAFALSFPAQADGIDCSLAKSKIHVLICSDQELLKLDAELNEVFTDVRQERAGVDGETGRRLDPVGKEEWQWILQVRNKCNDVKCLKLAYRKRIGELTSSLNQ